KAQGVDAYVIKSDVKSKGEFFRVRTGNFPTMAEAQKYGADLKEKGVADQFFVARYEPSQGDLTGPAPVIAQVEPNSTSFSSQIRSPSRRNPPICDSASGPRGSKTRCCVPDWRCREPIEAEAEMMTAC